MFRKDLRVGYLRQTPAYPEHLTVLEACLHHGHALADLIVRYERCVNTPGTPGLVDLMEQMDREDGWGFEQRVKEMLGKLQITDLMQPIGELSGASSNAWRWPTRLSLNRTCSFWTSQPIILILT